MLQQDAMHIWIVVQCMNFREQFLCGGVLTKFDGQRFYAHAAARIALHFYVGCRGRICAHEDSGEDRGTPVGKGFEYFYAFAHLLLKLLSKDRKSTRLNSSHVAISYAVFCLKQKNSQERHSQSAQRPDRGSI